jgi:4-aminobutyrate aminotransferase-like enzyme
MLPDIQTEIPGKRSLELAKELQNFECQNITYLDAEFPIFWERASATNVWDVDGNRYLDLTAAFGVAGLGHGNSAVLKAMHDQADKLLHGMGDVHPTAQKAGVCRELSALTFERWGLGRGKTILGSSGFEAVEAALKTAFLATGKAGVVTFDGCYHGLGFGTLSVEGAFNRFREPFRGQLANNGLRLPFPHVLDPGADVSALQEQLEALIKNHAVGAILVEPIQGRGGKRVPADGFLAMLRRVCDAAGVVLIFDEIYSGFNRTGELFACDHWDVQPDIICLGKALTGGFPLSACVGKAALMDTWPPSDGEALHTSTFLGHPVGCAMALASLKLHAMPEVAETVRRNGLMLGLELNGRDSGSVIKSCLRAGLIVLADGELGEVLALTPPFGLSEEEIRFAARVIGEAVQ